MPENTASGWTSLISHAQVLVCLAREQNVGELLEILTASHESERRVDRMGMNR
jgi:hypothetical protein